VAGKLIEPQVNIPPLIEQGDSPSWIDEPFTDDQGNAYDAANYGLVYTLAGATSPLPLTGVATGTGWTTSITTAQSAALSPGTYWWQVKLTAPSFALTVARGELIVTPNLASQAAGYSGYTLAEQNLLAAQQQLANIGATESYKIGTREMRFRLMKDILEAIAYWNALVINEKTANSIAQKQGNPRKLYARFPSRFGTGT
jgi:hypothetical protein